MVGPTDINITDDPSKESSRLLPEEWAGSGPTRVTLSRIRLLVFSIPPTAPNGLACGWLDISAADLGFGVGYLNRRGIDMVGDAIFNKGVTLGWNV
ncbi:MAG: hypothetical protein M3410_15515 [Acidobacteriota bacterium]|nr:hypothetical protein [Acidobacteriota bacterium]